MSMSATMSTSMSATMSTSMSASMSATISASISCSLSSARVRGLTLLLQHVKQTTLAPHKSLEWPSATVMMIFSRLGDNAWKFARHLSPAVWLSECHWALELAFLLISARKAKTNICLRHQIERKPKRPNLLLHYGEINKKATLSSQPLHWFWTHLFRTSQRWPAICHMETSETRSCDTESNVAEEIIFDQSVPPPPVKQRSLLCVCQSSEVGFESKKVVKNSLKSTPKST